VQVKDVGEFGLIRRWEQELAQDAGRVARGIGDDTAVLNFPRGRQVLATTDTLVESVHFDLSFTGARQLGKKCMAVNFSDIAAMGGRPRYALIALGLPGSTPLAWLEDLYRGMQEEASRWSTWIVGGDTVRAPSGLVITVTVLGDVPKGRAVPRDGARLGDLVVVTGDLGGSAAGLASFVRARPVEPEALEYVRRRHLEPVPRLAEGEIMARHGASSMIDVSDGLASEVNHLSRLSRVSLVVEADRIPLAPATAILARTLDANALEWALNGGEDYELVATVAPGQFSAMARAVQKKTGTRLTVVGRVEAGAGCYLVKEGKPSPLEPTSYDHFRTVGPARTSS
jgi:thiamine-monophosphate kinase